MRQFQGIIYTLYAQDELSIINTIFSFNQEGEDAVQFANRVKSAIAIQGGLTELPW